MRKTTTRMLALTLSMVMSVSSFAVGGRENKVYAGEASVAVVSEYEDSGTAVLGAATPTDASEFSTILTKKSYVYDGNGKTPEVTITNKNGQKLRKDTDYTCSYENNTYPGTASVTVSYKGEYTGKKKLNFTITKAKMADGSATQTANSITMKWSSLKGATEYKLQKYANNKWNTVYTGKDTSFAVKSLKSNSTYKFKIEAYSVQNGKNILLGNTGTIIRYTNPGKVTGGVSGVPYKNKKNIIESSTHNSVVIGWTPVKGASGYIIYQYNSKTKKWAECSKYTSMSYDGADKNKEYYIVEKLKPATGYMFKVAAYKDYNGKVYKGEKSDVIKSATAPVNQYGYDDCFVYDGSSRKWSDYFKVELKGCSSKTGYYLIHNKNYYNTGKQVRTKVVKTNKSTYLFPTKLTTNGYYCSLSAFPYYTYNGKIYVNREYNGSNERGNIRTTMSKLAGVPRDYVSKDGKYRKSYYQQIFKGKNGKVSSYYIMIDTMKKTGRNSYQTISTTTKYYNAKMRYTGMEKFCQDKYSTSYVYNARNKLVKYRKNVYSNDGTCIGYNEYNAKGKVTKKVRF